MNVLLVEPNRMPKIVDIDISMLSNYEMIQIPELSKKANILYDPQSNNANRIINQTIYYGNLIITDVSLEGALMDISEETAIIFGEYMGYKFSESNLIKLLLDKFDDTNYIDQKILCECFYELEDKDLDDYFMSDRQISKFNLDPHTFWKNIRNIIKEFCDFKRKSFINDKYIFDMDGTLFEWIPQECLEVLYEKGYYRSLSSITNMQILINQLIRYGYEVYVGSAYLSNSQYALDEKKFSILKDYPEIGLKNCIFCDYGKDKSQFIQKYFDSMINQKMYLIDDYSKNLFEFQREGGNGIKVMNGINGSKGTWQDKKIDIISSIDIFNDFVYLVEQKLEKELEKERI